MNDDIFNNILKKIEETDWHEFFEKERKEKAEGIARISNRKYLDWLISFIGKFENDRYDDEYFLYHNSEFSETDVRNEKDIHYFYSLLEIVADIQRVKEYHDDRDFDEYEYVFKYRDKFYEKNTLIGQGSITTIQEIEKPDFAFIDLDLYLSKEENNVPQTKYKY